MRMGYYRRLIYEAFQKTERSISRNSFSSRSAAADPRKKSVLKNVNEKKSPANLVEKRRWYQDPRYFITLGFVGCVVVIPPVCYRNSETMPYAKRGHFVLTSTSLEKKIGESFVESLIKSDKYKGKILDSHHPESIRVNKILQDIIGGLVRKKIQTSELYNWEIVVVDEPAIVNASSAPGGKIVIYTGLLNHFKTDAEIAIGIGHEVGHVVARHHAEEMFVLVWMGILTAFMLTFLCSKNMSNLLLRLPLRPANLVLTATIIYNVLSFYLFWCCSTWNELEADYIGMLISASAGYDPRIAPEVYAKLTNQEPSFNLTHPNGNNRIQQLSQHKVMEEALAIYAEALNDKDNE